MHDIHDSAKQTLFFETLAHVLKGNIGAGLFAMGDAFKNSGFALGIIGIIFIGCICIYNNHLLVLLSRVVQKKKALKWSPSFAETVTYSFELGPSAFNKMSRFVMLIMKIFIVVTQLGFCVIYITLVSTTAMTMIENNTSFQMNLRLYMLATIPPILAVSLIHSLKFLAPVSAVSIILIAYGFAVSIIVCLQDLPDFGSRKLIAPVNNWPLFIGTVIFSFEGISLVIPLKNEMKNPEKFDSPFGVLNIGMTIVMCLLMTMGFISYYRFGEGVSGTVTFDLPPSIFSETAQIAVALGILLSYPLQFYVPVKLLYTEMKQKWGLFKYPMLIEVMLRIGLVLITYIFALAVPHVNLVVSLIGAVCSNALALLFPALSDICVRFHRLSEGEKEAALPKKPFRLFMDFVSIALSAIGAIFGTYVSVLNIVTELKEDMGLST